MNTDGTVLVTGASGQVGHFVAADLVNREIAVRRAVGRAELLGTNDSTACRFRFEDRQSWPAALDGVDRVFLMRPPAISDITGVIRPFVAELVRRNVRQVVVLSLMGVNPAMPHWRLERDVVASRLGWTMLRPAFFMQNLETAYLEDIRDFDRIRLPAGRGATSFIDTRDIAAVAALCFADPDAHIGRAYTLTGPQALDWNAVASVLSAELGRPINYEPISLRTARRELTAAGLPRAYVRVQLLINIVARLGLADTVTPTLAELLGRPSGTIPEYVHDRRELWIR